MSKTVPVIFGDHSIWAFDVYLGVLLLEAIDAAGPEIPQSVLDDFRGQVEVGASFALLLDDLPPAAHELIAEAGRRMRARGTLTRAEAERRYPMHLRFEQKIDGAVAAELADAIGLLVRGELPPAEGTWFYGVPGGPRVI